MPKVYGTGVYDFRRHRVAEYALDQPPPPPPAPLQSEKPPPAAALAGPITLSEIQRDRLTRIAAAHWGPSPSDPDFKPELVKDIYHTELLVAGRGRKTVPLHRVMILEVSQYLENYLWPNFHPDSATFEHVMSIILMLNEKVSYCLLLSSSALLVPNRPHSFALSSEQFRENVAAWACFRHRNDAFKGFLSRVLRLKEEVCLLLFFSSSFFSLVFSTCVALFN